VRRILSDNSGHPQIVDDEIIGQITSRLKDGFIHVEPVDFNSGDAVVIKAGPLKGIEGIFLNELKAPLESNDTPKYNHLSGKNRDRKKDSSQEPESMYVMFVESKTADNWIVSYPGVIHSVSHPFIPYEKTEIEIES
jgi:hypothetical protein